MKRMIKVCANSILGTFGYEVRRRTEDEIDQFAGGFPTYFKEANKIGMDVNDYEERKLGWREALPILTQTVFQYLREDSIVCNVGVGTGRWARHLEPKLTKGELHLVDNSPWIVEFVRNRFQSSPRVHVHLNNGYSLPFANGSWMDLIFSYGTFIELKLGLFYLYSREFFRVLKPGGYCIIEYIDGTTSDGWDWLESRAAQYGDCFTYYAPQLVERVFSSAGFGKVRCHQIGKSTYLIVRKLEAATPLGEAKHDAS